LKLLPFVERVLIISISFKIYEDKLYPKWQMEMIKVENNQSQVISGSGDKLALFAL